MKGPELFGVVVRSGGFVFICQGLGRLVAALLPPAGYPGEAPFIMGLALFAIGAAILWLAQPIVDLAYFRKSQEKTTDDDEPQSP